MSKNSKKREKLQLRIQRLMARLTLLNSNPPQAGDSPHRIKMWAQEHAQITRQLKRRGLLVED